MQPKLHAVGAGAGYPLLATLAAFLSTSTFCVTPTMQSPLHLGNIIPAFVPLGNRPFFAVPVLAAPQDPTALHTLVSASSAVHRWEGHRMVREMGDTSMGV